MEEEEEEEEGGAASRSMGEGAEEEGEEEAAWGRGKGRIERLGGVQVFSRFKGASGTGSSTVKSLNRFAPPPFFSFPSSPPPPLHPTHLSPEPRQPRHPRIHFSRSSNVRTESLLHRVPLRDRRQEPLDAGGERVVVLVGGDDAGELLGAASGANLEEDEGGSLGDLVLL